MRGNRTSEKPKNFGKTLIKILTYSKKLMPLFIIVCICAFASSIFSIIAPDYLTDLVNTISSGIIAGIDFSKLKSIALLLVIIYVASAIFNLVEGIISATVANKLSKEFRSNIETKINRLPLKYFDTHFIGDTLSRVTNDVDLIGQSMSQSLGNFIASIALLIGSVFMMFKTNFTMAITAVLSSAIGFVFMMILLSKSQKYFIRRQTELGKMNSHIEEIYTNYTIVKAYNGKKSADKKFDELNESLYECNRMSQFLSGLMQPLMMFIGNFSYVAVCVVGAILTINGNISFGVIVAFIVYVRLFTNPLAQIAQGLTSLQSSAAAAERVFEFLESEEMTIEENKMHLRKEDVKGSITFDHVNFAYDKDPIIKDFSLDVKPGEKVAIVGPTGAGKTTLVNLLMKFYEINNGDIKIDGISTKDLTRENIHNLFIMVLQDTWLFNGTIKENLIYNKENVSDKKLEEVIKTVGLTHFIKTLPEGINTEINDSNQVSSGEKQLLTIARGMIEDAPFLILDEATSNVDTRTEELVSSAMDKLTEGKTSFIIAHRLSTIKNADKIIVMREGDIVESGTHEELIAKNGFYADLYNSQFAL